MAADAIVEATVRFLAGHAPFSRMPRGELLQAAAGAESCYFPAGSPVLPPGAAASAPLHVIQRGHVRVLPAAGGGGEVLGIGECFPAASLASGADDGASYLATEDTFCLRIGRAAVAALRERSVVFRSYCEQAAAALLREALGELQRQYGGRVVEQQLLLRPLTALTRRAPVACLAATPLRQALAQMQAADVGTIVVVDDAQHPLGIFTLTDLLGRVVLPGLPLATPVGAVMTPDAASLDGDATAHEALALMAGRGLHQVLVTRDGRLTGVVSERDLFALQRASLRNVLQALRNATAVEGLKLIVADMAALTESLIAQGMAPESLTQVLTSLNDAVTRKLLGLLAGQHGVGDLRWCWLSLGSEGRREQTVASDQDNALVFEPGPAGIAATRARLLPFARAANEALASLGFPLCPGNIMAGNPECCLSVDEWRVRFAGWLREPTPDALLGANIYFDLRALHGDAELARELQHWLLGLTQGNQLFLGLLVANAVQATPPLGVIRAFRTGAAGEGGTIDLKTEGTRLFVDAARALALAFGLAETGTAQRLRLAGQRLGSAAIEVAAMVDAFQMLQLLRLRAGRTQHNRIDPYSLNALDQRLLKEALLQARSLQLLLRRAIGT